MASKQRGDHAHDGGLGDARQQRCADPGRDHAAEQQAQDLNAEISTCAELRKPTRATADMASAARLISRLMRMARCGKRAKTPISSGSRNSAPPRPIKPPRTAPRRRLQARLPADAEWDRGVRSRSCAFPDLPLSAPSLAPASEIMQGTDIEDQPRKCRHQASAKTVVEPYILSLSSLIFRNCQLRMNCGVEP